MSKSENSPKKKKGCFRWLIFAFLLLIILIGAMALFGICPPAGPWPTPPWCSADSAKYGGLWGVVLQGKCPPPGPWPNAPWCEDAELKAKTGESAVATFWVTIPFNLEVNEVSLAVDGHDLVVMDNVGELSYQAELDVLGGEELTYTYLLDSNPTPTTYHATISRKDQYIYDAVYGDLTVKPALGVFMHDTWGRNYNFTWMEDTHNHVETAFARVAETGVSEVIVADFHTATWNSGKFTLDNLDYFIEGDVFINDQRDEEMGQDDLNRLVKAAHAEGLKIAWSTNFTFVDFGTYIGNNVAEMDANDKALVNAEKSEAWVLDFMAKWKAFLLDQAVSLESAGFDAMFIQPGYHNPNLAPNLEIADDAWQDIIEELRKVFSGELRFIYGDFPRPGNDTTAWKETHEYYSDLDRVYIGVSAFNHPWDAEFQPAGTSFEDIKASYQKYYDVVVRSAQNFGFSPSLTLMVESSEDFLNQGFVQERYPLEQATQFVNRDWQYQADCYEALMQITAEQDQIKDIMYVGYGWDDAMDPENSFWPISLSATPRNKPAEAVIKKWAIPIN